MGISNEMKKERTMKKQHFIVSLINMLLSFFLISCIQSKAPSVQDIGLPSVQQASRDLDTEAKKFIPMLGEANIYIYQKQESVGTGWRYPIIFNEQSVGEININTYLLLSAPPGKNIIRVLTSDFPVQTEANKNYFIMLQGADAQIKLVSENEGQEAVQDRIRAKSTLLYNRSLRSHISSKPERSFTISLKTLPKSADIIVEQNGFKQEIGTTPCTFSFGLSGEYEYNSISNEEGEEINRKYSRSEYKLYMNSPLLTIRNINNNSQHPIPELHLKCLLEAEGFESQSVERVITFKESISITDITSWIPETTDIVVGLNKPIEPEYTVKVIIDSVPSGADIYTLGDQGYLGEKLGTTPAEFEVGFANRRSVNTGAIDPSNWSLWRPNKEEGFINWSNDASLSAYLNFVLLKDEYARQDITRWTFHTPDTERLQDSQKTITIPLKTTEEARQERLERIEQARTALDAALKRTELELKSAEISNQRDLIRQQELISNYLSQLNTTFERINTSTSSTMVVKNDPHYNREWQDAMSALGTIVKPYSKASPLETEQNIQALQGFGALLDLLE